MPVDFLTLQQELQYGRYREEPSQAQLARYFHLDDFDQAFLARHKGPHNRLGLALQLTTVRFLGTFVSDFEEIPQSVIFYVGSQLSLLEHLAKLPAYFKGRWHWEHPDERGTLLALVNRALAS